MGRVQVGGGRFRHSLLQQQGGRLESRDRLEASLHGPVQQQAGQGQQAHALVVRHKRMHNRIPLAAWQACLGVVDGFIQAKAPSRTLSGKALQVAAGGFGLDHQCQCAGVGRNHGILAQAALEPKAGDTEGSILVIEVGIQGVIARLGHAPGYAQPVAVLDLQGDGSAARLVQ
ncbi:hypothetical protein D3C80_983560 [compost metagenome]